VESVKVCLACKRESPVTEVLCPHCGASTFVGASGEEANASPSQRQIQDGTAGLTPISVVLEWPWGCIDVVKRLPVGRDEEFSELAAALVSYDNVSRRHAEVLIEGDRVYVRDAGSRNGTYINGRVIQPHDLVPVFDGDELRFARDLRAKIRIGR